MSLKTLSEAIILQSAEDVLSAPHKGEDIEFFSGEGFRICSEIAGMSHDDKLEFLNILLGCISKGNGVKKCAQKALSSRKAAYQARAHRRMATINAA